MTAGDVDQHALGPAQADLIQKRVGNRLFGGLNRAVFTGSLAGAHHRLAHFIHHGADIGKVEVDKPRAHHQIGDALDALIEHVIGHGEGFGKGGAFIGQPEQVLVRDDDQGIDHLLQRLDPLFGLLHPLQTFELERLGDNADGQHPKLTRRLRDDRGGAGTGAAAHAGGDETHMCAGQMIDDLFDGFLGGGSADGGARARSQPFGDLDTHLDFRGRPALGQGLSVGVGDDKLNPFKLLVDHVVDRVATGTADAKHRDPGFQLFASAHHQVQCHRLSRLFFLACPPVCPALPEM